MGQASAKQLSHAPLIYTFVPAATAVAHQGVPESAVVHSLYVTPSYTNGKMQGSPLSVTMLQQPTRSSGAAHVLVVVDVEVEVEVEVDVVVEVEVEVEDDVVDVEVVMVDVVGSGSSHTNP